MNRRISALLAALIVALGVVVWASQDIAPQQRSPLDVGAVAELDVRYGPAERNLLDVYTPATRGPHPVIVYFHPGGWVDGDKSWSIPIWDWTEQGYAVVSANYTLAREPGTIHDSVDDAETAVRFVLAEGDRWDLDTDRLGVFGFSAGGHLAVMVSQRDLPVLAVALVGAPTNLRGLLDPTTPFFDGRFGPEVSLVMRERLGCAPSASCVADATLMSPTEGTAGAAPVLIVHGGADPIVDSSHAVDLERSLRDQGAEVELVIVEGGLHWADSERLAAFFNGLLTPSRGRTGP